MNLSLADAQRMILEAACPLGSVKTPLDDLPGCVFAEDIVSEVDISPFRNSAMDGFAVVSSTLSNCTENSPVTLPVAATVYAGGTVESQASEGQALKIMTGAPVPDGYDAVVKVEDVSYTDSAVTFSSSVSAGTNIRPAGEDVTRGQKLFARGALCRELDIGSLAAIGRDSALVYRKPTVLVMATGDELVEPGTALEFGQIYNSNSRTVRALVRKFCESVTTADSASDSVESLSKKLDTNEDVVVTSGGVSAGDRDFVIEAAESVGWETVFHKVAIKPGKPLYFARRGRQLLFGLPGNPLSTAVTCALFVIPALKKILGRADYQPTAQSVTLIDSGRRASGRTLIWPGKIHEDEGQLRASYSEKTSSAALTALLDSDGLIITDPAAESPAHAILWRQILD